MPSVNSVILNIPVNSLPATVLTTGAEILTAQIKQRPYATTAVPLTSCRTWDAMATNLPAAAALDDMGLVTGTPGTDAPMLSAGDVKATSSTRKAAFELEVPANYEDGQSFEIRLRAAVETTVADTSCTVDLQVYEPDGTGAVGGDICATSAQSINSVTPANYDFAITASGLAAGDKLICVLSIAYVDAATATAVTPVVYSILRRCDTRG